IFALNRDEYLGRPTHPIHFWEPDRNVLAPLDLEPPESQRGTWLGMTRDGRVAFVTNYLETPPMGSTTDKISRGELVRSFLAAEQGSPLADPIQYAQQVFSRRDRYAGFSLVLLDLHSSCGVYVTNRNSSDINAKDKADPDSCPGYILRLDPDILYGLSNSTIETEWPKVIKGKQRVGALLLDSDTTSVNGIHFPEKPADFAQFVCIPLMRADSFMNVSDGYYASRTSHVIIVSNDDNVTVVERTFHPAKDAGADASEPVRKLHLHLTSPSNGGPTV
ncbi:hypothetical protein EV182_004184, partial [Spiromyces aspiralis]